MLPKYPIVVHHKIKYRRSSQFQVLGHLPTYKSNTTNFLTCNNHQPFCLRFRICFSSVYKFPLHFFFTKRSNNKSVLTIISNFVDLDSKTNLQFLFLYCIYVSNRTQECRGHQNANYTGTQSIINILFDQFPEASYNLAVPNIFNQKSKSTEKIFCN